MTAVKVILTCFCETLSHPPHNSFKSRLDSFTDRWKCGLLSLLNLTQTTEKISEKKDILKRKQLYKKDQ